MKNYEAFKAEMRRMLAEKAEREGYRMTETKVYKVNQKLDSISIRRTPGQRCQAALYLQDMYRDYMKEMRDADHESDETYVFHLIMETTWTMLTVYPEFEGEVQETLEQTNYMDKVTWELVSPQRNEELLKTVPHRQFLDLAVIYRIQFNDAMDAIVTHSLAEQIGMNEEMLYQAAKHNRETLLPTMEITLPTESADVQMAFLTTSYRQMYGAALLMETEEIKRIADRMGSNLYICPSSIHELVLTPAEAQMKENLEVTIWEANRTVTGPEVYLSDTLYYYDRAKNEVQIA